MDMCVPPIVCICQEERADLFVAASSYPAGGPPNITYNTTTTQAHHHSIIQQGTIDTCVVNNGVWVPEMNTDASLLPEPSQVSPGGSLIRSDLNTTEGFPSMV